MNTSEYAVARSRLVDWLKKQLIGPASEKDNGNLTGIMPLGRYPIGVLYPIDLSGEGLDPACEDNDDVTASTSSEDSEEEIFVKRRYVPPSSIGFSFFVANDDWQLQVITKASRYILVDHLTIDKNGRIQKKDGGYTSEEDFAFERNVLGGENYTLTINTPGEYPVFPINSSEDNSTEFLGSINVVEFTHDIGKIVTVSLVNKQQMTNDSQTQNSTSSNDYLQRTFKSLFEVELDCYIDKGDIGEYPDISYEDLNQEQKELHLQYQHKKVYAIGHGVAVDWHTSNNKVIRINSDFLPTYEVPNITADIKTNADFNILSLRNLADISQNPDLTCSSLTQFVDEYLIWIDQQYASVATFEASKSQVAHGIIERMRVAEKRMRQGIEILKADKFASKAFGIANKAMMMQMQQTGFKDPQWRPFQLAFLLLSIASSIDENDLHREDVDLIWFPTGGGKTEAYLAVAAFVIAWRRMKFPTSSGGTVSFMRYTLRLLTTQQFSRACRLICALELLRQNDPRLGTEEISIGLWVGSGSSPNRLKDASEIIEKTQKGKADEASKFVLTSCPWCQSPFNSVNENLVLKNNTFRFHCTNPSCDFGAHYSPLPCHVIDEVLYKQPPTLLVGTLDKFALLAWDERTQAFFGTNGNRPPELIIQDELHLISSALGSIAGVYEAAISTVIEQKNIYPKYIASTATIKEANSQVLRLFARQPAIFPPVGINSDDSYFAKVIPVSEKPGRLYLGYLAPMLSRQKNLAPLAAALLLAPIVLFSEQKEEESLLDAWWTILVYHGSLKGVGNSHNSFNILVKDFIRRLLDEYLEHNNIPKNKARLDPIYQKLLSRLDLTIAQLTSNSTAQQNETTFSRLALSRSDEESIDVALATNMVSVGLDVSRMALMVINGQPITTSEYIQASSRVGRSTVPGLVIANYYRDQSRSLSHYENFKAYHQSFYRHVEPTSVTPYTFQARKRALHAGLVIALRHSIYALCSNNGASNFDKNNSAIQAVIHSFTNRCIKADPDRGSEIKSNIQQLVEQWQYFVDTPSMNQKCYKADDKSKDSLLYPHGKPKTGEWATLNSMRNVENTGLVKLL